MALLTYAAVLLVIAGCEAPQQQAAQPEAKNRVPALQEPPPPPAPPAPEREPPYYGSTYWDELLTSVYYYPNGGTGDVGDVAVTHLKFEHREDDLYLCGDQRKSFEPGSRYRLLVTYEPNQPCVSNWRVK